MLRRREPNGPGTAWKLGKGGHTLLLFERHQIVALRPQPARAWVWQKYDSIWRGSRSPPVDLQRELLRLAAEDAVARGDRVGRGTKYPKPRPSKYAARRRANFRKFFDELPPALVDEARRWPVLPWEILQTLENVPGTLELAQAGHRALVFMLANVAAIRPRWLAKPNRAVRAQMGRKLPLVCGYLGLPPTKSSVKLLKRLPPTTWNVPTLRSLGIGLANETCRKHLLHAPTLSAALIQALTPHCEPLLSPKLIEELAASQAAFFMASLMCTELRDTADLFRAQHDGPPPRLHSMAAVRALHDALSRAAPGPKKSSAPISFPPAPVTALDPEPVGVVRYLPDAAAMHAESEEMNHCLGQLWHVVGAKDGRYATWAIEGPERLTLALRRDDRDVWLVDDLRGWMNELPSDAAVRWAYGFARRASGRPAPDVEPPTHGDEPNFDDLPF